MPTPLWRPTLEDYIDVAGFLLAATPDSRFAACRASDQPSAASNADHDEIVARTTP